LNKDLLDSETNYLDWSACGWMPA